MPPRRISMAKFRGWAAANLHAGDALVIETTTNVWDIYDIVAPLTTRTVVAHAGAVRQIAEARVKTDKEDVKRLIRLLADRRHRAGSVDTTDGGARVARDDLVSQSAGEDGNDGAQSPAKSAASS